VSNKSNRFREYKDYYKETSSNSNNYYENTGNLHNKSTFSSESGHRHRPTVTTTHFKVTGRKI
jgi:hypothetical protein